MSIALTVCVVGGIVYLLASNVPNFPAGFGELGRLAFAIGLAFYLYKG